jgi:hypothetical protein
MVTFVESPLFTKQVHDYLTDVEYGVFQAFLPPIRMRAIWYAAPAESARCAGAVMVPERAAVSGFSILPGQRPGKIWLLLIYAKSAVDSIPGHILKALKEEMENATR